MPVSLADIVPSVLDWAGLPLPEDLAGISLLPSLETGQAPPLRPVVAEVEVGRRELSAVIRWPYKLIRERQAGGGTRNTRGSAREMLFDISRDPLEAHDLMLSGDPRVPELAEELRLLLQARRRRAPGEVVELDPQQIEELRALGYIE